MSSQQQNFIPQRVSNKLTLDSQQQQKQQQQQRIRNQQYLKKKQQKRKKRQQAQKQQIQRLKKQQEKLKKYQQPQIMFQQDSQSGIQFKRVQKKINRNYPQFTNKYDSNGKKRNDFIVNDNIDDQSSSSDSGQSSQPKKAHKQKKIQKRQKQPQKVLQKKKVQPQVKKQKVKVQHKSDRKQRLVREVSIRWWYALPEWPPADFDYQGKLKDLGYRVLDAERFKLEDDVVNGLEKVMAVYGYKGVYKSKTKLIDVRPKQSAPTLNNFRNMSIQELSEILKKALTVQISQLKQVQYKQKGEDELMVELERQLRKLRT